MGLLHVVELQPDRRGHQVQLHDGYERVGFGGGQVIARNAETGVLPATSCAFSTTDTAPSSV